MEPLLFEFMSTVGFNGTASFVASYNISFYNLIIDRNATSNAFTIGNASTTNIIFAITNNFSWIDLYGKIILGLTQQQDRYCPVPSITILKAALCRMPVMEPIRTILT